MRDNVQGDLTDWGAKQIEKGMFWRLGLFQKIV